MQKLSHNRSKFDDFRSAFDAASTSLASDGEQRMAAFSSELNLLVSKIKSASRKVGALIFNQDLNAIGRH